MTGGDTTTHVSNFPSLRLTRGQYVAVEVGPPRRCRGVEENFYAARKAQRKAERAKSRRKKAFGEAQLGDPLTVDDNDDRCLDLFINIMMVVMMMSSSSC
jgi:hypothetical protein